MTTDQAVTAEDLDKLRHMLGVDSRKSQRQWGYRNYYASSKGDEPAMRRLQSAGFVRQGRQYEDSFYFHATEEGCKAVGLNAKQIKRAMED